MASENNGSNAVSFGLGALLGVGAGVFLSTKKGRKIVKQAWKQIEPYLDDAVDAANEELEGVKSKVKVKADELKVKAEGMMLKAEKTFSTLEDRAGGLRNQVQEFKTKTESAADRRVSQLKDLASEKLPPSAKKPIKRTFFKGI